MFISYKGLLYSTGTGTGSRVHNIGGKIALQVQFLYFHGPWSYCNCCIPWQCLFNFLSVYRQEEIDAAIHEEDGSGEEDKGGQKSGEDSDGSSFGLDDRRKASSSRRLPQEAKAKSATQAKAKPGPAGPAPKPGAGGDSKAAEKGKAALENATKALGTLAPITPASILSGSFKDVDSRLKKVSGVAAQLRQLASATEAEDLRGEMDGLAGKMESKVSDISVLCEAIQPFRNAKQVQNLLKDPDLKPKLEEACPLMDAETLATFLLNLASKLSEARLFRFQYQSQYTVYHIIVY